MQKHIPESRAEALAIGSRTFKGSKCSCSCDIKLASNGSCLKCYRDYQDKFRKRARESRKSVQRIEQDNREWRQIKIVDWKTAMQGVRYDLH